MGPHSGVKQFNKGVKGAKQIWHNHDMEPISVLRVPVCSASGADQLAKPLLTP